MYLVLATQKALALDSRLQNHDWPEETDEVAVGSALSDEALDSERLEGACFQDSFDPNLKKFGPGEWADGIVAHFAHVLSGKDNRS